MSGHLTARSDAGGEGHTAGDIGRIHPQDGCSLLDEAVDHHVRGDVFLGREDEDGHVRCQSSSLWVALPAVDVVEAVLRRTG